MFLYGFVGSAPCGGLLLEKLQACTQPGLDGYGAALMQGESCCVLKAKKAWRHWHSSCRRAQRPADWYTPGLPPVAGAPQRMCTPL